MNFFKDKERHVVIWQWPNMILWGWIVSKLLTMLNTSSQISDGLSALSTALLFTWAYLEITKGVSYFRRTLGAIIMLAIVIGFFN